jgi:hypothetical protein
LFLVLFGTLSPSPALSHRPPPTPPLHWPPPLPRAVRRLDCTAFPTGIADHPPAVQPPPAVHRTLVVSPPARRSPHVRLPVTAAVIHHPPAVHRTCACRSPPLSFTVRPSFTDRSSFTAPVVHRSAVVHRPPVSPRHFLWSGQARAHICSRHRKYQSLPQVPGRWFGHAHAGHALPFAVGTVTPSHHPCADCRRPSPPALSPSPPLPFSSTATPDHHHHRFTRPPPGR